MPIRSNKAWGERAGAMSFETDWLPPQAGTYAVNVESFEASEGTRTFEKAGLDDVPGFRVRATLRLLEDPWQTNPNVKTPRAIGANHTNFFVATGLNWDPNDISVVPPAANPDGWASAYWQLKIAEESLMKLVHAIHTAHGQIRGVDASEDINFAERLVGEGPTEIRIRVGSRVDKRSGETRPTFSILV